MLILKSIAYITIIVWLIIPIRQFKTRFFLFFLILGLLDPIAYSLGHILNLNYTVSYLFGTIVLLYPTLFEIKRKIKLWLVFACLTIGLFVVLYPINVSTIIQIVIHFIIFISFLRILVVFFSENRRILLFHLMLVVYEFSLLLKFFVYYHEVGVGPAYYYVTTSFQIMIGIFFLFVNEVNRPKLII
ncbi:MAG: hypothetical protein A2315_17285 [Ignavibacteria bacterium RIFOXYB2_FULL_35_12]|nr:MAG: hypothetical protein A2058_05580 [Ignavibacteria bacterium GWA2_36_19]OGU51666.1 MAG: hypothetical protein A2006_08750 [Ignavibacteria bacterium GWC2_35_8]OGU61588.1 MAG: hypothetical protein A2X60_06465 [Ignavibacteria bacterium GWF2_35_20]OGU78298.1 MAG: hypothetical protein A2254_16215 [Ignavibacteria bacterium RIFOXYA2_FULL_35_9]OGU88087.1 MAG: hypothetical protein A3K31_16535 [Ignavibacteria bacterium RIFOXYA12_FULL_35_25]OGU93114.1 MAG: hypothetical protein A2347_07920 [Ignavibac